MKSLPTELVAHLAGVARLELTPRELEKCGHDLEQMLRVFESLSQVSEDSNGSVEFFRSVEPIAPSSELSTPVRSDVVVNELARDVFLAQSADTDGVYVRVPLILGGG